jgi:hypothetical protein
MSRLCVRTGTVLVTALVLIMAFAPRAAEAQDEIRVQVYHGGRGATTVTQYQAGNRPEQEIRTRRRFYVSPGDTLCFELLNGHPVFYSYGVDRVVDSTAITIPSVTTFASVITGLIPQVTGTTKSSLLSTLREMSDEVEMTDLEEALDVQLSWHEEYIKSVADLEAELEVAKTAIAQSDQPELLPSLLVPAPSPQEGAGYRTAQETILALGRGEGHFNSPSLRADLQAYYDSAVARMNRSATKNPQLLAALKTHADALLSTRDAYLAAYGSKNSPRVIRCSGAGSGLTTATLRISRRDSTATVRDTGAVVKIQMIPRFERPTVELVPLVFGAMARDVPEFSLVRDTVRVTRDDGWAIRPGAMMLGNLLDFGPRQEISLGAGLGFGLGGDNKIISDILVGPMLSYREMFRVGVATGMARFPSTLRAPAEIGRPLPPDAGKLDDLTQTRLRRATFLVFILPGIKLPD